MEIKLENVVKKEASFYVDTTHIIVDNKSVYISQGNGSFRGVYLNINEYNDIIKLSQFPQNIIDENIKPLDEFHDWNISYDELHPECQKSVRTKQYEPAH